MAGKKGMRIRKKSEIVAAELIALEPMTALELLKAIKSNELWIDAVRIAKANGDAKALVKILTYLDDKAFGRAADKIDISVDVRHHSAEALEIARSVAREILTTPPLLIGNSDDNPVDNSK